MNSDIIKEIYNQGKERLQDQLDTKKTLEQKAFILLTGFIALSTAFLGIGFSLLKESQELAIAVGAVGIGFLIASVFSVLVLRNTEYGTLGSDPDMWLKEEYKNGDKETLDYMFIYLSEFYQKRIDTSRKNNKTKIKTINISVLIGIISPLLFLTYFL